MYHWVGIPKYLRRYSEEEEQNKSESKNYCVTDKGLAREAGYWATFSNFEDNEGEAKSLDCAWEGEDEWELALAEYEIEE